MGPSARQTCRRALTLALVAAIGCGGMACRTDAPRTVPVGTELRVGLTPDAPPLVYVEGGVPTGIEPELAQRLGQSLGRPVTFVELPRDRLIPALREHEVDILMSGLSVTEERSALVLFARPYLRVGQQALIRREDAERFTGAESLRAPGARVGFVRGSAGGLYVGDQLRSSEAYAFPSTEDAIRNLRARRIDFFIHGAPALWRYTGELADGEASDLMTLQPSLTEEHLAWAVAPDDRALKAEIDQLLLSWSAGGELDALLARWIPGRADAPE
jgi:polar amino acid transport system substrate-binding protein